MIFLAFEGLDGSGKSSLMSQLEKDLNSRQIEFIKTREPGGTVIGDRLREIILKKSETEIPPSPRTELLLYQASRAQHVDCVIAPALKNKKWVLCDRFIDSTRAYQGVGGNLDISLIDALERVTIGPTRPDLTLILDVPAEDGLARAKARSHLVDKPDRFEGEGLPFHETLRRAFLEIARLDPLRCAVIDASGAPDDVERLIWLCVRERLLRAGAQGLRQ